MCNIDCNECYHLNMTEYEQRDKTTPHICELFKKRVIHRANKNHHDGYLYPHNLCNGENFKSRSHKYEEIKVDELKNRINEILRASDCNGCKNELG